jgi:hypothetical protein
LFVKFYDPSTDLLPEDKNLVHTWDTLGNWNSLERFSSSLLSTPTLLPPSPLSFYMAQVDCTVATATCTAEEVLGYPTILFYKNGIVSEKYSGERDLMSMKRWVESRCS